MKLNHLPTLFLGTCLLMQAQTTQWIGTWGASPASQPDSATKMLARHFLFNNQTLREIVHVSAGGTSIRIRLSNAYNKESVSIGPVHVATAQSHSDVVGSSDRAVLFGGNSTITIPPGALVLSDPIALRVPASSDLAISLYLPQPAAAAGIHYSAQQTMYVASGDQTARDHLKDTTELESWIFLTGVDVESNAPGAGTIVAFGDSITDGARSEVDANHRWPNYLSERLLRERTDLGVLDEGIGGNRILHDGTVADFGVAALARFDRDVLAQPGVRYVIVLEGINDIGHAGANAPLSEKVSANDLIAGYKQMIARAHEKNIKIFGATLTPFTPTVIPNYFSPEKESVRKAVNEWIRTSNAFDGVIDFDKAIRDPQRPDQMLPIYDGGDHLHPGDKGYQAMADAIDLALFR